MATRDELVQSLVNVGFGWESVPYADLSRLCQGAECMSTDYRDALFRRGDSSKGIHFVLSGKYKLSLMSPEGREQIIFLMNEGRLITEGFANGGELCKVSCFAQSEASAWNFSAALLEEVIHTCGAIGWALSKTLAYRQSRMLSLIYDLSLRSVEQRLGRFLLYILQRENGRFIKRELDVQTVAALLGTTREEITRAQKKLSELGFIKISRRSIEIIDIEGLEELI